MILIQLIITLYLLLGFVQSNMSYAQQPFCVANLGTFDVHESNKPRFGTPILSGPDGSVYIAYIDPSLQTVLRQYNPASKTWTNPTILTNLTHDDDNHTQPSIGIDQQGYIHAAYNHHNSPWQYKVSQQPHTITEMIYKGQPAGDNPGKGQANHAGNCTGQCETDWYSNEPGIAAIPGNQITYPHFANTIDGTLFVAYRECLKCDVRTFHSRQWSAGISRYNQSTHTWTRVAGIRPWATESDKLPVALRLTGDVFGSLHASWLWCPPYNEEEGGNGCFAYPNFISYAVTHDYGLSWYTSSNGKLTLPLSSKNSEIVTGVEWFNDVNAVGYYNGHTILSVDTSKTPTIVVFPNTTDSNKKINRSYVTKSTTTWLTPPIFLDYAPSLVYRDNQGRWIAVSSGLRIHISLDDRKTWRLYPIDLDKGTFTYAYDKVWLQRTGQLRLYAQGANNKLIIYSLTFVETGNCG